MERLEPAFLHLQTCSDTELLFRCREFNSEILVQGISSTTLKITLPVFLAVYNLEVGRQETRVLLRQQLQARKVTQEVF